MSAEKGKPAKQKASGTILIVDDEPKNLQFLGTVLRHSSYEIVFASSAKIAFKKVEQCEPDLILMDVMMPETSGWEVCERLKRDKATREIPVIFLTALSGQEDIRKCFEVGGVDYIAKPFQIAELLARVKTHFELKIARDKIVNLQAHIRSLEDSKQQS